MSLYKQSFKQRGCVDVTSQEEGVTWQDCFDDKKEVVIREGEAALKLVYYQKGDIYAEDKPLLLFLHGAGYGGLSWGLLSRELKGQSIIALDMRFHGESGGGRVENWDISILAEDIDLFISAIYLDPFCMPPILLVGHSMGGAIMNELVDRYDRTQYKMMVMIDIVEGTAIESIPMIYEMVKQRPDGFASIGAAIESVIRHGFIHNRTSAQMSIPPLLEERSGGYYWKTNLLESYPYWAGWYQGMGKKFLGSKAIKVLMIADPNRLDTTLTVAQMAGKYQLEILPTAGHNIHEDMPQQVAEKIRRVLKRYQYL